MVNQYIPSDFLVEELIQFPDESGAYGYYRVEKRNISAENLRKAMASQFKVTPSAVVFPALRDFPANAVQYASVRQSEPEYLEGQEYAARRVRHGPRALHTNDLQGNRFTVKLRRVPAVRVSAVKDVFHQLQTYGLPNYFGMQRFRSMTEDGFIGKALLLHKAEKVIRLYLGSPMLGDSKQLREFKALVAGHWGQWGYLLHQAPRPSNFRSVVVYLKDHPHDYEKAVNIIRDQRLSSYLVSYQSWVWNHILAHYIRQYADISCRVVIADMAFPLLPPDQHLELLQGLAFELPRLTVAYTDGISEAADKAFADEQLSLQDFNVRLVQRAYLAKINRATWFAPTDVRIEESIVGEKQQDERTLTISFVLPMQHYATLVMKAVLAYMDLPIHQ